MIQSDTAPYLPLGVLSISGPECKTFTQGLITIDVLALSETQASLAALCDAKGRMFANFLVFYHDQTLHFLLPQAMIKLVEKNLKKYALFSKVTLITENWYALATQCQQTSNNPVFSVNNNQMVLTITYPDNQGQRLLKISKNQNALATDADQYTIMTQQAWERANINSGIAKLTPQTQGLFTPQMINLDKLNGISFNKGCYLGQEIIARTQHLGKLKRHLYHIQFNNHADIDSGSVIYKNNNAVGTLLNHVSDQTNQAIGLAVIEDRALDNTPLQFNDETPITAKRLSIP